MNNSLNNINAVLKITKITLIYILNYNDTSNYIDTDVNNTAYIYVLNKITRIKLSLQKITRTYVSHTKNKNNIFPFLQFKLVVYIDGLDFKITNHINQCAQRSYVYKNTDLMHLEWFFQRKKTFHRSQINTLLQREF